MKNIIIEILKTYRYAEYKTKYNWRLIAHFVLVKTLER